MTRSWLCVPADNDKKMARVAGLGADAVVLDLALDLAEDARAAARRTASAWLADHRPKVVRGKGMASWVRISGLDTPWWREDLVAAMAGAPHGIILARAAGPEQVKLLASDIYELEQANKLEHGSVGIIPQVGESAAAALEIPRFADDTHPRLAGLAWNPAGLAQSLGARRLQSENGEWSGPAAHVRTQTLLTARAKRLMAIDAAPLSSRDAAGQKAAIAAARADGFTGIMASHPRQVAAIKAAFAPSAAERSEAEAIVAIFAQNPNRDRAPLNGRMVDRTQLAEARDLLGLD